MNAVKVMHVLDRDAADAYLCRVKLSIHYADAGVKESAAARAAVARMAEAAEKVAGTLEMGSLVKPSRKNENAGFIDMRDWYALKGEVSALRDALAAYRGEA